MKRIIFCLLGILLFSPVYAANQIQMTIDKDHITTDEAVQITIQIEGDVQQGNINLPGIENFTIAGQSTSKNMRIINGETQSRQTISLALRPNIDGVFTLGPITITDSEGNAVTSEKKTITVEKSLVQATKEKLIDSLEEEKVNPPKNEETTPNQMEEKPFPEIQKSIPISPYLWLDILGLIVGILVIKKLILIVRKKR